MGDIVGWDPITNGFVIFDTEAFSSTVLNKYFSHNNMTSFVRQLNNYGFSKVSRGDGLPQYFHKYFIIGKWDLLYKMGKASEKPLSSDSGELDGGLKKNTLGCRTCKELPPRVVKLENTVNYLLNQVKELQLVNQALTSYICANKMYFES